jgi:hypothetical protein
MKKETNMTFEEHINECRHFGVVPLDTAEWARLMAEGLTGEDAYSVASDLCVGFSWEVAIEALKNSV